MTKEELEREVLSLREKVADLEATVETIVNAVDSGYTKGLYKTVSQAKKTRQEKREKASSPTDKELIENLTQLVKLAGDMLTEASDALEIERAKATMPERPRPLSPQEVSKLVANQVKNAPPHIRQAIEYHRVGDAAALAQRTESLKFG